MRCADVFSFSAWMLFFVPMVALAEKRTDGDFTIEIPSNLTSQMRRAAQSAAREGRMPPVEQLTPDPDRYLAALKEQLGAVIGKDSTGKWDIAYFQTSKNAGNPYFFLLYPPNNKSISFSGVLLCQSSSLCLAEQDDEILIRTASIPKDKLDGGDMRWLDLGQTDADGNYKAAGNGKFYPISGTTVFHIPKDALTSLVSNPRKATPASRLSSREDHEQAPTVRSGAYVLHVGSRNEGEWKGRLKKLWETSGEGSHIFGSQQQENRAKVEAFIAREIAKDKQMGIKDDEWDPIVEIKMFIRQADKDSVVEYTGRGLRADDGRHPCKLWWIYTRRPHGELKEEC